MDTKLSIILTLAALIGLADSVVYLMSFWRTFEINIFEFAGLTDFAKLAIFPLSLVVFSIVIVGLVFFSKAPKKSNRSSWLDTMSDKLASNIAIGAVTVSMLGVYFIPDIRWKWYLGLLASYPLVNSINRHEIVRKYLPNSALRVYALSFTIVIPLMSGAIGAVDAIGVIRGEGCRAVDNVGIAANLMGTPNRPVMFVGFVNDTFILYETQTHSVVFIKQSENSPLILKPKLHCGPVSFFN